MKTHVVFDLVHLAEKIVLVAPAAKCYSVNKVRLNISDKALFISFTEIQIHVSLGQFTISVSVEPFLCVRVLQAKRPLLKIQNTRRCPNYCSQQRAKTTDRLLVSRIRNFQNKWNHFFCQFSFLHVAFEPSGTTPRFEGEIIYTAMHVGTRGISKFSRRVVCQAYIWWRDFHRRKTFSPKKSP